MELLAMILDPNKSDPEISITTYRHGTAAWIEQMKIKDLQLIYFIQICQL